MTGSQDIIERAALVDAAATEVRSVATVVAGLRALRWRSPAALAYRAEIDGAVTDLARVSGWLDELAGDLRRLATIVGEERHG